MNYKDYIEQNIINTTSDFEEYLKEIHSEYYMGTDDNMPDKFNDWLLKLDTSELIYYADEFKTLAEQSLVQRVREAINARKYEMIEKTGVFRYDALYEDILSLPILSTPKPKGDK